MENLNAEQVKKALEYCANHDECVGVMCPYYAIECENLMPKDALALITSQEQRIGAQDMTISKLRQRAEKAEHDASRYEQRIKELDDDNARLYYICQSYALQYGTATDKEVFLKKERADTAREMHSEIKERCIKGGIYPAFAASTIDQIAKEMIEKGD